LADKVILFHYSAKVNSPVNYAHIDKVFVFATIAFNTPFERFYLSV